MSSTTLPQSSSHSFRLTEEQEQLRREIRAFAAKEIAPHVMEWDEASEFPAAVVKQLGHMGLLGVLIPGELGGAELGYVDYMMAIEEISAVDGSIGIIMAAHNSLGMNHIYLAGNAEQHRRLIPKLATGEWLAARATAGC
jgi:alkylation response protein AidB-like acyl-CoA dehydrogenase